MFSPEIPALAASTLQAGTGSMSPSSSAASKETQRWLSAATKPGIKAVSAGGNGFGSMKNLNLLG